AQLERAEKEPFRHSVLLARAAAGPVERYRGGRALAFPLLRIDDLAEEIELDRDVVRILEEDLEELRVREAAEVHLHAPALDAVSHFLGVLREEGDVVHRARAVRALRMLLEQEHVAHLVRFLRSEVHADVVAGLEPIAGKAEVRPVGELQPEHVLVEPARALEILRYEKIVVELGNRHSSPPVEI